MDTMERYGIINEKQKREIVLLKGRPCAWGRCTFCDYTADNTSDSKEAERVNRQTLSRVTGLYGALEVVNSGSVFELDEATLAEIRRVADEKRMDRLYFESAWMYRERIGEIRQFFGTSREIIFKCGIETFDDDFRNDVLNKNIYFSEPAEVARYFDSVCLLVGVAGQTRDMVARDISILRDNFHYGCVNIFVENTTGLRADNSLIAWFKDTYGHMENFEGIDVLWNNTDFGIGGASRGDE